MNLLPYPRSLKLRPGNFIVPTRGALTAIKVVRSNSAPNHPNRRRAAKAEGYALTISKSGIEISFRETCGLRATTATLRHRFQLYTQHTFAYRKYKPVWRKWGALTAAA